MPPNLRQRFVGGVFQHQAIYCAALSDHLVLLLTRQVLFSNSYSHPFALLVRESCSITAPKSFAGIGAHVGGNTILLQLSGQRCLTSDDHWVPLADMPKSGAMPHMFVVVLALAAEDASRTDCGLGCCNTVLPPMAACGES